MYEYINGKLQSRTPTAAVIDNGGVGYRIEIPVSTYEALPAVGENVELLIHFHVTDSDQRLYGFATEQERVVFRFLCHGVKNIGPKKALSILSGVAIPRFIQAIQDEDLPFLKKIKGVGAKTAERLIVELKDQVERFGAVSGGTPVSTADTDAVAALESLGQTTAQAEKAVAKARDEVGADAAVEEVIKTALQY